MIRLLQRKLIIPRGDSGSFTLPVLPHTAEGTAVFTLFDPLTKKLLMNPKQLTEENGQLEVRLEHSDTVNLPAGKYCWDIKFYQNPQFDGEEIIDGTEVDSYFTPFTIPECEVRETGDKLVTLDGAVLAPNQVEYLSTIMFKIQEVLEKSADAITAKETAEAAQSLAEAAAQLAESLLTDTSALASDAQDLYTAAQTLAQSAEDNYLAIITANNDASAAAVRAEEAAQTAESRANEIHNLTVSTISTDISATPNVQYDSSTGELSFEIPTGRFIASTVMNNNNTLTFTFNDGTTYTTPNLKGSRGDSFKIRKTYSTIAAMNADYNNPLSQLSVGDFVMVVSNVEDADNAKLYVKGEQQFDFVVDMSGASGINGIGIESIVKTNTTGLVDTYTINYSNNTYTTFTVKNGEDGSEYTVLAQSTQPTEEHNKLWIPTDSSGVLTQIATMEDVSAAVEAIPIGMQSVQSTDTSAVIIAETNTRYYCGELVSLNLTPCAIGECEVIFSSGTTPTVLTVPNTVHFQTGFNASALESNKTYAINILDGIYGVVAVWDM